MQNTPCLSAHATTPRANSRTKGQSGFTLMELMVAVMVVGILAAVAIPSYTSYINKSRAKSASADLAALALNMENRYQLQLTYPVYAANTAATNTIFSAWSPTQASYFNYTMVSTASSYTLTATGKGSSAGCTISLDNLNTRTASSSCGFTSW
ncbi:prepilin-type N-terminal cleavage/methylation domain-containing protein [Paucibacter sp. TC2R-5]|uniref:type IV pilin protein n=1 Tax=Paucibacter sp. TC2R-5 TaxID=2893555 RepID=UPI0021E46104|nr:type IV pilin protein [Paucibacter sp. TC2R-5]MCV2360973.1 prepilin-type N-terminal cleavage/methylation domain-containing protein [Paucibacter sp. TC2R-5]